MRTRLGATFGALLVSRNYRLYAAGQAFSLTGTWTQTVALGWLVLQLTSSGTSVGLVVAAQWIPTLLLAPLGGVLIDRLPTRKLLIVTQSLLALLALCLGLLATSGRVQLWMVYAIASAAGLLQVVDMPARQLFSLQLVGPDFLTNAVTLNTVSNSLARAIGPAVGAVIISAIGVGACFTVNAATFVLVVMSLLAMRSSELYPKPVASRAKGQIREGLRYVGHTATLRAPLVMIALVGALAYQFQVSLLLLAKYTFHGDGGTYGLMTSAMGIGAVFGGLLTASRELHGVKTLTMTSAGFGLLILAVAASPSLTVALIALVMMGAVSVAFVARASATVLLAASPSMRGRAMALWAVAFMGSAPVGGPTIGWIGEHVGPRWALAAGGFACLGAACYGLRQSARMGTPVDATGTTRPWGSQVTRSRTGIDG